MKADVIVVGGGIAGMAFAERITALMGPGKVRVLMLSKAPVEDSNSYLAQGGVAAVVLPEDTVEEHVQDTLTVGAGRCDPAVVRMIVERGPRAIARLLAAGARFDADTQGRLQLAREGGHSQARVVHYRDTTGAEIVRVLRDRVKAEPGVEVVDHQHVIDLLVAGEGERRRCIGVRTVDSRTGQVQDLYAGAVILATGGLGQVYRHTTNPVAATGDGIAMALRAGVALRDMAFVQFHPTALYDEKGGPTFLISEAVRGAGARLLRPDGSPLMQGLHPKGDLAPRNIVAREIHRVILQTGQPHVWLDTSPIGVQDFAKLFPNIANVCGRRGLVGGRDRIPVMPAAHYSCGGILTNDSGETELPGLFALGECASSGLHGADRLASNSLLEALVMPARAAETLVERPIQRPVGTGAETPAAFRMGKDDPQALALKEELRSLMTEKAGILRTFDGLGSARRQLAILKERCKEALAEEGPSWSWAVLGNMVEVALAIVDSALAQQANAGAHWCEDLAQAPAAGGGR